MGLSQDLKEFSAGFSTGFQLTSNLKEKRADREEKRADRAERARIADQTNATNREIYHVPSEEDRKKNAPPTPSTDTLTTPGTDGKSTVKGAVSGEDTLSGSGGEDTLSGGTGGDRMRAPKISGTTRERGQRLVSKLVSLGYTPAAAAGIAGNIQQESSFNPSVRPGDKGTAHGLAQWRGDRWVNMQKYAASKGKSPYDFDTQVEFIDYEMGTSSGGRIRDRMRKETDPRRAADLFALKYERPQGAQTGNANNIHGINNRRTWANAYYDPNAKPGTMMASPAIPGRGGFKPVDYSRDTLSDETAEKEPAAPATQDAGTGEPADETRQVAQLDVSTGGTGNDFITGEAGQDQIARINPYEEEPVLWGNRGGAIPTRRYAAAGAVDKYNPSRSYTQALPQADAATAAPAAGTVGGSTFVPRRVGQPNPNSAATATAATASGTGYGLGQVTPRQQALRDARAKAAAPPPVAAKAANKGAGKYAWSPEYGDEPETSFTEGQKAQMAAGNQPMQAWNSSKEGLENQANWQRWKLGEDRYREINTYTPQQFYADQEAWRWGAPTSSKFDIRYRPVGSPAQDTGGPGYAEGGTVQPSVPPRYAQGGTVVGGNRPYDDDPDSARERLIKRQAAAQGLTQGDIDRARSDPSRYGEIHLPAGEEKPAVKPRAEPKRAKPKAEPKKAEPRKTRNRSTRHRADAASGPCRTSPRRAGTAHLPGTNCRAAALQDPRRAGQRHRDRGHATSDGG